MSAVLNIGRRQVLGGAIFLAASGISSVAEAAVAPCPPLQRRVGIGYSVWHSTAQWMTGTNRSWGTPMIGFYRSDDPRALTLHATMLFEAGVDFVVVDWSNDLSMDIRDLSGPPSQRFIEASTLVMFDVWGRAAKAPRISLMIGAPSHAEAIRNGSLEAKASEVHALFVQDRARARMLETVDGRPLLLVYVGTPSPWPNDAPPWTDHRFEVRFVTGFLTEQPGLLGPGGLSRFGYWSWEDKRRPTHSVRGGQVDGVTVVAAWRGADSPGRDGGRTFQTQWAEARAEGPRFVIAGTFNEWWVSEQISPQSSKDVEPSKEFGTLYLDILRTQATLFKRGG